jgi:hypothetical protein
MLRPITAIVSAALIATIITVLPEWSRNVEASAREPVIKGDRLDVRSPRSSCEKSWPYYESHCLRDLRQPSSQPREVRFVSAVALRR